MLLPNPNFIKWFTAAIDNAKKSIVIVNYIVSLNTEDANDPVSRIASAIAVAIKRGVAVQIILEGSKFNENMEFYRSVKNAGADVWMDTSLTFIHTKAILIDDNVFCVGSHNLSRSALISHEELSLVTSDEGDIAKFQVELEKMTAQKKDISENVCRDGTSIPVDMVLGADAPLTKIKRSIAPHAYLTYLYLLRESNCGAKPVEIDAEKLAAELGFGESTASANVRIRDILDFLSRRELLSLRGAIRQAQGTASATKQSPTCHSRGLKHAPECLSRGRESHSRLVHILRASVSESRSKLSSSNRDVRGDGGLVLLPSTFWKYNWHKHLSVEAIHMYFAGEAEKLSSPYAPWWRLKRDEIAKKFGFQKQLVGRAQSELKKLGLLEVLFETAGKLPAGRYARYMNYFRQNPFYDLETRKKQIGAISAASDTKVFQMAGKLLSLVNDGMDAEKLTALCRGIESAGIARATKAAKTVSSLSKNSTKLTFDYVQELLDQGQKAFP